MLSASCLTFLDWNLWKVAIEKLEGQMNFSQYCGE